MGRIVTEDRGAIERTVVFGEVKPAFIANAFGARAADPDADYVGAAIEELFCERDEGGVTDGLGEGVNRHRADQALIPNGGAICEFDFFFVGVDFCHCACLAEACLLLRQGLCHCDPDASCTVSSREAEGGIWTPISGSLFEDDVASDGLEIWGCHSFSEPLTLHLDMSVWAGLRFRCVYLCRGNGPDFEVVWCHEDVRNALACHSHNPLIEVLGFRIGHSCFHGCVDHTVDTLDLVVLRQHGDVVLEGIWHPQLLVSDVGDSLVGVPVFFLGQGFIDAVVEVFVVGEDDVATDIVELGGWSREAMVWR